MNIETQKKLQTQVSNGEYASVAQSCEQLLNQDESDTEVLYILAVCQRYLGQSNAALDTLNRLKALLPEHGRAFQEEGHIYRDTNQTDLAIRAYSLACQYNPALLASWRAQLNLINQRGHPRQIAFVKSKLSRYEQLPPPLLAATDLVAQGKVLKAEEFCRKFLSVNPKHVEGMRLLADIGTRLGVMDDAEILLSNALAFEPDNADVQIDYISVLRKKQKFELAAAEAEKLLARDPSNPQYRSIYAIECMQTGRFDEAITIFDSILADLPGDPATLTSKGHALKTVGQYTGATDAYEEVLERTPQHGEAFYSLANLKTYTFSAEQILAMEKQSQDPNLSISDRTYVTFALGKAYEDRKDYSLAFNQYAHGNGLKKRQSRYSSEQMLEEFEEQKRICTSELLTRRHQTGFDAPDPIFILGLPRAGSTLLEQILASHSQVDGTLELPNIVALSHRLRRGDQITATSKYPGVLTELSDNEFKDMGEAYIRDTQIHRSGAPFFIDKMPNNFRHIGLIKLILPNAKIIDARRHPMSCCWSGFKQLFAEGQEFTYSLEDIGHYYRGYIDLMNHWHLVLPGEILTVNHGQVVDNLEGEVRRMLDFCGLPFEQACLDFHKTERSVRTPSSEQVRQPIFRDSIDAWQNFEAWLDPLKEALGPDIREDYNIA